MPDDIRPSELLAHLAPESSEEAILLDPNQHPLPLLEETAEAPAAQRWSRPSTRSRGRQGSRIEVVA